MHKVTAGIRQLSHMSLKKLEESTEKNSCTGREHSRHTYLCSSVTHVTVLETDRAAGLFSQE